MTIGEGTQRGNENRVSGNNRSSVTTIATRVKKKHRNLIQNFHSIS